MVWYDTWHSIHQNCCIFISICWSQMTNSIASRCAVIGKYQFIALCVKPLRNLALQGFAEMIPSAPILPLSLSNSLSFASIPIVKIGKNDENFNFQTLNPFSQWRAALTNFSFSRYFLKKSSFFSTKNFKFVGPALLFFGQKYPIYWYFSGGKIFVGKYLQFVNFWKRIEMFSSKNEHTLIFYF